MRLVFSMIAALSDGLMSAIGMMIEGCLGTINLLARWIDQTAEALRRAVASFNKNPD